MRKLLNKFKKKKLQKTQFIKLSILNYGLQKRNLKRLYQTVHPAPLTHTSPHPPKIFTNYPPTHPK